MLGGLEEGISGDQKFVIALLVSQGRHSACYPWLSTSAVKFLSFPFSALFVPARLPVPAALLEAVRR